MHYIDKQNELKEIWLFKRLQYCNKICTVKPVHNGHPWDPEKVAVVQRVAVVQGLVQNSR